MKTSNDLFSTIAGCTVGLFAAGAIFLTPLSAQAELRTTTSDIAHDHEGEEGEEKSCGSEKDCGGCDKDKSCDGDKDCEEK